MSALARLRQLTSKAERLVETQRTLQEDRDYAISLEEEITLLERRKAEALQQISAAAEARPRMRRAAARPRTEGGVESAAERGRGRRALSVALAHRLMGRSVFFPERDPGCVGVRFDTSFQGSFAEQYYVIFQTSGQGDVSLRSHTLPAFLPVAALAARMLPKRVVAFVDAVRDAVRAYVFRRESVRAVLRRGRLVEGAAVRPDRLMATEGFDRVQIDCERRDASGRVLCASVRVAFPLAGVRAAEVEATQQGPASRKRRRGRHLSEEETAAVAAESRFAADLERAVAAGPVDRLASPHPAGAPALGAEAALAADATAVAAAAAAAAQPR